MDNPRTYNGPSSRICCEAIHSGIPTVLRKQLLNGKQMMIYYAR